VEQPVRVPQQRPVPGYLPGYSPWGQHPALPPQPRRSWLWPVLTTLLVISMLLAVGGASIAAVALRGERDRPATTWVPMRADERDAALSALLKRRADAIRAKSKDAFLADVDQSDPTFVKREQLLFENLAKIPFAELVYDLGSWRKDLQVFLPKQVRDKFHQALHVGAVTVRYRVEGVDSTTVATPWLPIFVYTGGRWLIGAEANDKELPFGANGQAWDAAGPITVLKSKRIVAVLSAEDADRGPYLMNLAEQALDHLGRTKSSGWDGKVFVTAVQDKRIFDTYFSDSPERIAQVAAIAVPYYDRVPDWSSGPRYTATRIVFNPQELSAQPEELLHDLTHEFAHAAMGPVTTGYTPRWLVEGFAEYAAYNGDQINQSLVKRALGDLDVSKGLPTDDAFYKEPRNYVGAWLACRMIAERYGQSKLISLYEAFQRTSSVEAAIKEMLGVEKTTLESQWQQYVNNQRK
jgi:hypothetical protein